MNLNENRRYEQKFSDIYWSVHDWNFHRIAWSEFLKINDTLVDTISRVQILIKGKL